MAEKEKTIDQLVAEFRNALVSAQREGKPLPRLAVRGRPRSTVPPEERERLRRERLARSQVAMSKHDARRIQLLLREAQTAAALGQLQTVFALAEEIAHMCRVGVLGFEEAYPVLPTIPPMRRPPGISSLPAPRESQAPPTEPPAVIETSENESE